MLNYAVPAEFYPTYQPSIDRFDIAIRAVMRLFRQRNWECLNQIGIEKSNHEDVLTAAELYVDDVRADHQIAALLDLCPFLLSAALELLRRYSLVTASSKREWMKENGNTAHLPRTVRQRHAR